MGSVKEVVHVREAFENSPGEFGFVFSDHYSVFDWGWMPDEIPGKGAALAVMAAHNFEMLEKEEIKTHYQGLLVNGKLTSTEELAEESSGSRVMVVEGAVVYPPIVRRFKSERGGGPRVIHDYSFYQTNRGKLNNYLLPLEIVIRNGLPRGSSVFKRITKAKGIKEAARREEELARIVEELGLDEEPVEGMMLPMPVLNYTTKLEAGDRHLSEDEAYRISGLPFRTFDEVAELALEVNRIVTTHAEKTLLKPHWDGKIELVYQDSSLVVADVVGTLDEDRFGQGLSKERLRQYYEKHQPEFRKACSEAKKSGPGWQERCPVKPAPLPPEFRDLIGEMYQSATNEWVGRKIFPVRNLEEVLAELARWE